MTTQPRLAILQFSSRVASADDPTGPTRGLPRFLAGLVQGVGNVQCEVRDLQRSVDDQTSEAVYLEEKLSPDEALGLAQAGEAQWCLHGIVIEEAEELLIDASLLALGGAGTALDLELRGIPDDLSRLVCELATRTARAIQPAAPIPPPEELAEGYSARAAAMWKYLCGMAQSQVNRREALLDEALEVDPRFVEAGLELVQCHLMRREFEQAEQVLVEHTARDRISQGKLLHAALRFFGRGFVQEAVYMARKAMMWAPELDESYVPYIRIALLTGNVGDGIKYTQRAEQLAPDKAVYQAYLSLFHRFLQQPEQALAHGRRAVELGPDEAFHHYALGSAHLFSGDIEGSLPHFEQALGIDPFDLASHRERALACCEIRSVEQARAVIDQSLVVLPTDAFLLTVKARTFIGDDPAQAEQCLLRAIGHQPSFADAHGLLGHLLRERGDYATSQQHLEQAIALDGQNAEWYRELGRLFLATSNPQQAQIAFQRAQELEE